MHRLVIGGGCSHIGRTIMFVCCLTPSQQYFSYIMALIMMYPSNVEHQDKSAVDSDKYQFIIHWFDSTNDQIPEARMTDYRGIGGYVMACKQ